jgi:uncharacterized protein YneF (UPF0154 family)
MEEGREARLRAAVGPRADFYLDRWKKMDETGRRASWNWAACLLNVFWFAYRKMWVPMLAMGLVYLVATPLIDPANPTQLRIVMFTLVGLSFLTGTFGNWLYRRQVEQLIARTPAVDDEAARAALNEKGGTSLAAAIGAFVGLTVLSLVAGMIPALLAQP